MQAVNSLRMESGYRHWETEIGPEDTPYEAGLGFCVDLAKGDFVGRAALLKQENGIARKLAIFTLDDPEPLLLRSEPVFRNGEHVSEITSGAYAFKLERPSAWGTWASPAASPTTGSSRASTRFWWKAGNTRPGCI